MSTNLDKIVSRLQCIHSFNVWEVNPNGEIGPWLEVTRGIIKELVLYEDTLAEQVQLVAAQIMYWGRVSSQAKRVWEVTEREYRQWRDKTALEYLAPEVPPDGWKRPTEKIVDCTIRTLPGYRMHYEAMERAEEAYNSALAVLDGFRAKKDVVRATVYRATEGSAPRLSV